MKLAELTKQTYLSDVYYRFHIYIHCPKEKREKSDLFRNLQFYVSVKISKNTYVNMARMQLLKEKTLNKFN